MSIIQIADNDYKGVSINNDDTENIKQFANKKIKYLKENNLFILSKNSFKDDIENSAIIEFDEVNNKIYSGNIMGFIGYNDTQIKITSRFASEDEDYFLHYMLQKVLCLNIFDFKHSTNKEDSFDFLIYMFLDLFQKAIRQGIYKSYQRREYNDANVRGAIDINRHIKNNIPFNGKVAYKTREYSYDNNITQLIRHTIEYINTKSKGILNIAKEEVKNSISQMIEATSSYDKNKRQNIINKNLKKLNHPYFYEYEPLRKICVQILRHEEIKYGREENKIYGVLFDGAYLWEEYIWTILQEIKDFGFKHPENKKGKGWINLLKDNKKSWKIFPDFYSNDKKIVLDTKYKRLNKKLKNKNNDKEKNIEIEDRFQIISYIYTLGAKIGAFVYPLQETKERLKNCCSYIGELNNSKNNGILEASIYKYGFLIPNENVNNIKEFSNKIKTSEGKFKKKIKDEFQ